MKLSLPRLVFAVSFLLFAACPAQSRQQPVAPTAQLRPNGVVLVPHRAVYKVSLSKARHDSALHDVSGTMLFDMADACDGWTVHQHMQMSFAYEGEEQDDVSSTIVTWEAKDGKSFNFNVKRTAKGQEDESFKGRATLEGDKRQAVYSYPQDKSAVDLPELSVFPLAHTKMILEKAMAGEKMFTRRVFDATDEEGSSDVSAFLRPALEETAKAELPADVAQSSLISGHRAWPVRLAFFPPKEGATEPDYEMDLTIQDNGVARNMVLDYGAFSISGTLVKIEPAQAIRCSGDK